MSFLNASQQIQKWVGEYGHTDRTYSAIDFIMDASAANNKMVFVDNGDISNEGGKLRQVKVSYFPILSYTDPGCGGNLCSAGTPLQPKQITFNLKQCTATPVYQLSKDDIRYIDGYHTFSEIAKNMIMSAMPQWRRNFAIDLLTTIGSNLGVHLDGNATHQVQPSLSSTGQVNPVGLFDIEREFLDGGLSDPFIIGGLDVYNWMRSTQIGAPNLQGQDISKLNNKDMYYDDGLLNIVLGDTANGGHIVALDPIAMKMVGFSENAGIFSTNLTDPDQLDNLYFQGDNSFIDGTFLDTVTGILLDFNAVFDRCSGTNGRGAWKFQIQHRWDIFFLPEVVVNAVGPTFNGILHYRTCVPVTLACPTGTPLPSPVSSRTYTWTPSFTGAWTLPLYIAQSTIAGVTNNPNVNITNIADLCAMMNDAAGGYLFTVSGSSIVYTGYSAISGSFNNGDITFSFS